MTPALEFPWQAHYDAGVPPRISTPDVPLTWYLERAARTWPRRAALWSPRGSLSYQQLLAEVQRFAAVLAGLRVRAGDRVFLSLPNWPQLVVALYGTLWRGAVAVLAIPSSPPDILEAQVVDSEPRVVVAPGPLPDSLSEVLRRTGPEYLLLTSGREYTRSLRGLLRFPRLGTPPAPGRLRRWRREMRQAAEGFPYEPVPPEDPAVIEYTSGSTGRPRGAVLTHRALVANAEQLLAWDRRMRPGQERILTALPLTHAYGLTTCVNLGLSVGATLILVESFEVEGVLDLISRLRPTLFPGIPAFYVALLSRRDLRSYHLDSIRACLSGSAPLPVEVQEGFERVSKARLVEGYGLTEASPVTHAGPLYGKRKAGSIGVPLPSTEARVVDMETGVELPCGRVGEILVRGPQLMQGYWRDPEATARVLREGWLHTGDLGLRDEDGFFFLINRKAETLRLPGGRLVFPRDVEEVLYEVPAVNEAGVAGWPPPESEEGPWPCQEVWAFVVARPGQSLQPDEVLAYCRRRLPLWMVPARVWQVSGLPRTPVGKLRRRELSVRFGRQGAW